MRARSLAVCVLSLWLAACAEQSRPVADGTATGELCHAPARPMVRLELLFGTARPDGRAVTDADWAGFLDREVTPRFPAGLTVLRGLGQWRGSDGRLTRERSNVVIIWYEPTDRTEADIEAIRHAYERQFDQQSVMRVESVSCVSF